ncbi:MAG: hypothetical protein KDD62_12800, partial [Bdellovibrionales bacterium]|nr:hypothetical protein [Bdellovibrionales bacterium]
FWYSDDDVSAVMSVLEQAHYQKDRYVVLIAGAQFDVRFYKQYGKALNSFCLRHKYPVVAIGAEADQEITEVNLKDLSCPYINLCGKTSLPQTAALLANAKIALGAETAGAHIAAAVKTPHVILLGGGHFGRFMPYSAYTSAVSLPLQCFACNWRCQFDQCYCVTDIAHEALTLALEETHQEILDLPRLFVQGRDYRRDSEPLVTWSMEETYKHLNLDMVRLIPLNNKNQ